MTRGDAIAGPPETPASIAPRVIYESLPIPADDVVDTSATLADTFSRDTSDAGICVADGMGLRIQIARGGLAVEDGVGPHRRTRRFDKATHGLRRLVISGSTGNVSLDALHWCRKLGIGVVLLAPDGTAVLASTPRVTDDARLRRVQALAPDLPVGIDLARSLIAGKLAGQARVLSSKLQADDASSTIVGLVEALGTVATIDEIRQLEATAAALYWQTWVGREDCVPRFATKDLRRVPAHWTRYEGRRSVLSSGNSNKKAERPTNAILSYLYKLVEVEAILACAAVGLDPGFGFVHLDARGRQSLALDIIEPVRPEVDAYVLELLARRTFKKAEFTETSDGHCRLKAPLTHELAETLPTWAQALAPVAERVVHTLGQAMSGKYEPVTPLTTKRHRAAQATVKARKQANRTVALSDAAGQQPANLAAKAKWSCLDCGGAVSHRKRVRCDACINADSSQTLAIRSSRAKAIATRKRALKERGDAGVPPEWDEAWYRSELLPRLAVVPLKEIMEAAGCSKGYASDLRRGKYLAHVSTWSGLAQLADVDEGAMADLLTSR
jgi:CRISPR-associated endonuclease Cas1